MVLTLELCLLYNKTAWWTQLGAVNRMEVYQLFVFLPFGPWGKKTCLRVFLKSEAQTSLLSYIDYLEIWNFACSKPTYDTFQKANNKGADQTAPMRRLVCIHVIRKLLKQVFSRGGPLGWMDFQPLSTLQFHFQFSAVCGVFIFSQI